MVTEIDLRDSSPREFKTGSTTRSTRLRRVPKSSLSPIETSTLICSGTRSNGAVPSTGPTDPDAEPREVRVSKQEPLGDGELGTFDVRDLIPQRRHEVLLDTFNRLGSGEGFVLVNDHDPKPLYYELRSMHGDVIDWEYASRGSGEWRVEIMKTDASIADNEGVITRYDVQEIPKSDRHETIHHRYGMIPDGEKMEIVAPHEPRPLRREFREQYGDTFDWEVVEKSPGAAGYRSRKPNKANPRPTVRPPRRRRLPMTGCPRKRPARYRGVRRSSTSATFHPRSATRRSSRRTRPSTTERIYPCERPRPEATVPPVQRRGWPGIILGVPQA